MYPSLPRHALRCLLLALPLALAACGGGTTRSSAALAPAGEDLASARVPAPQAGNDLLNIWTLPVGAGNCQLMKCPSQNKMIMFDCGSTGGGGQGWNAQQVQQFINHYANAQTEFTVSVSHADADHSNFIPAIFGSTPVSSIVIGDQINNYAAPFQQWTAAQIQTNGARLYQWQGLYRSVAAEPSLSCFAPNGQLDVASGIMAVNAGTTKNDHSMVVGSIYGGFQTVFTGDMTGATEGEIVNNHPVTLNATDVITGAHHGADTHGSNSQNWATATQPQVLMFSSGTRHLHPRCTAVQVYRGYVWQNQPQHGYHCGANGGYVPVVSTEAIVVTNDNGLINVKARNDGQFEYSWGNVVVTPGKNVPPTPMAAPH